MLIPRIRCFSPNLCASTIVSFQYFGFLHIFRIGLAPARNVHIVSTTSLQNNIPLSNPASPLFRTQFTAPTPCRPSLCHWAGLLYLDQLFPDALRPFFLKAAIRPRQANSFLINHAMLSLKCQEPRSPSRSYKVSHSLHKYHPCWNTTECYQTS